MGVEIPPGQGTKTILEIGCGLAMYAPLFMRRGYLYSPLEVAAAAADWVENTFDVDMFRTRFEDYQPPR
jgi:hypothetical protein